MNRRLVTAAAALVLFALPSFAAIQYEYSQKNTSDDSVSPMTDLSARAVVDGPRSRVDFLSGNSYPPGTYVISTDNARNLYFVDPVNRWYTEYNAAASSSPLAGGGVKIANVKSKVETREDRPLMAGLETRHYTLTLTYNITMMMKTIPLTQSIETIIDFWTTDRYPELTRNGLDGGLQTGNVEVDRLLNAEASKIQGFPLRQILTVRATFDAPRGSQLKVPSTRTVVRETWVTSVREMAASPAHFIIPASFRRADMPDLPRAATETLTFDPPSK